MKAVWKNKIIAESQDINFVEGNAYFPVNSLNKKYLKRSEHKTMCPVKGVAKYLSIEVDGEIYHNAIWYYNKPPEKFSMIKERIAFMDEVKLIK